MTSSTQAMNNVNKVQAPANANKSKPAQDSVELNFNDLFSSALGQKAPNAQLNSIESQLRESLFKQDSKAGKKNTESNSNAEAAQAAVWAQRTWMQNASVPNVDQSAPPAASTGNNLNANRTNQIAASKQAEPAEQPASPASQTGNAQASNNSDSEANKPLDNTEAGTTASTSAQTSAVPVPVATAAPVTPAAADTTVAAQAVNVDATQIALPADGSQAKATTNAEQALNAASLEQTSQASTERAQPNDKSTGNSKVDAVLNNSTVQVRAEQSATGAQASTGNSSAVAAQLAPQIAQQAQNIADSLEPEGLKVGQKILAAGNLQATGSANGIAAGTNGLNGTLGNAPQALIKTPVNQPGFAKEVGQTVQWAIGKNLSTVDIRVNPESFGPMNMRLVQKGQQVQLVIRTQDEASANLLTQALGGLKEVLAQNGLQLNQVQIQHGNTNTPNGQGNPNQAQFEQQGNGQGRNGQQSANGGSSGQDTAQASAAPAPARKAEGKLDLFA